MTITFVISSKWSKGGAAGGAVGDQGAEGGSSPLAASSVGTGASRVAHDGIRVADDAGGAGGAGGEAMGEGEADLDGPYIPSSTAPPSTSAADAKKTAIAFRFLSSPKTKIPSNPPKTRLACSNGYATPNGTE